MIRQLTLVAIVIIAVGSALAVDIYGMEDRSKFLLEFSKRGGFAGFNQRLIISGDGNATFWINQHQSISIRLDPALMSELRATLLRDIGRLNTYDFEAKEGSVDFFQYALNLTVNGKVWMIGWVDEWASKDALPYEVKEIGSMLDKVIQIIMVQSTYSNTKSESVSLCSNNGICGKITMTVFSNKQSYNIGEQVKVFVIVTNHSPVNLTYSLPTPCHQDIRITVSNSSFIQDITNSDIGESICILVIQQRSLGPNQTIIHHATWDLSFHKDNSTIAASRGKYFITATFPPNYEHTLLSVQLPIIYRS